MAELYQKDVRTINEHLQNIYKEAEIDQNATIRNFRIVREEGSRQVTRSIDHYNLEAILAVGYRVRSTQGSQLPFSGLPSPHLSCYSVRNNHAFFGQDRTYEYACSP